MAGEVGDPSNVMTSVPPLYEENLARLARRCPSCAVTLRLPAGRSGMVRCPNCRHRAPFDTSCEEQTGTSLTPRQSDEIDGRYQSQVRDPIHPDPRLPERYRRPQSGRVTGGLLGSIFGPLVAFMMFPAVDSRGMALFLGAWIGGILGYWIGRSIDHSNV